MNHGENDDRLADLESRLAFQELALETLSDAMATQQAIIERLRLQVDHLGKRFREVSDTLSDIDPSHQPPPHY